MPFVNMSGGDTLGAVRSQISRVHRDPVQTIVLSFFKCRHVQIFRRKRAGLEHLLGLLYSIIDSIFLLLLLLCSVR